MGNRSLFPLYAAAASVAMLLSVSAPAHAATVLTWTGGSVYPSSHDQTIGWSFTANQSINVSGLDWYDPTGTNTIQHTVDLWTSTGTLLGTACVGLGCAGSSYNASYWQTPVSISLGTGSYVIGGFTVTGDPFNFVWTSISTDPAISYGNGLYQVGGSLTFPTNSTGGSYGVVGPNFEISAATPLPAALPLFATGLGAMGLLGWRRKRKGAAALAA